MLNCVTCKKKIKEKIKIHYYFFSMARIELYSTLASRAELLRLISKVGTPPNELVF